MDESDPSALAAELRLVIGQLVRRVRVMEDEPFAHRATLGYLDREGPMTTSELAHAQHVRPQSMARTVGQLAEESLVRFAPHPSDRRKTLIELTDSGRHAVREGRVRRAGWLHQAIAEELTAEEQRVLAAAVPLLNRMAQLPDEALGQGSHPTSSRPVDSHGDHSDVPAQ